MEKNYKIVLYAGLFTVALININARAATQPTIEKQAFSPVIERQLAKEDMIHLIDLAHKIIASDGNLPENSFSFEIDSRQLKDLMSFYKLPHISLTRTMKISYLSNKQKFKEMTELLELSEQYTNLYNERYNSKIGVFSPMLMTGRFDFTEGSIAPLKKYYEDGIAAKSAPSTTSSNQLFNVDSATAYTSNK